jgi:hypothetical protein
MADGAKEIALSARQAEGEDYRRAKKKNSLRRHSLTVLSFQIRSGNCQHTLHLRA